MFTSLLKQTKSLKLLSCNLSNYRKIKQIQACNYQTEKLYLIDSKIDFQFVQNTYSFAKLKVLALLGSNIHINSGQTFPNLRKLTLGGNQTIKQTLTALKQSSDKLENLSLYFDSTDFKLEDSYPLISKYLECGPILKTLAIRL